MSTQPIPEPTPFEKMTALASKVLSVPKSEVEKREGKRREERDSLKKKKHTQ
jgi:hypothetical protein